MTTANLAPPRSTEVVPRAARRQFTKEYKLTILERADGCKKDAGDIGLLLRQEALHSSQLHAWRVQRRDGTLAALGRKRGPKKTKSDAEQQVERLLRDNARLRKKLVHAEKIIDVQKKLSEVLGVSLGTVEEPSSDNG